MASVQRLRLIRKRAAYFEHLAQMYQAPGSFARDLTSDEQQQLKREALENGGRWAARKRGVL